MSRVLAAAAEMIAAHDRWIDHALREPVETTVPDWAEWRLDEIARLNAVARGVVYLNEALAEAGLPTVTVHDFRPRCQALLAAEGVDALL